jgi:hypothetical protein
LNTRDQSQDWSDPEDCREILKNAIQKKSEDEHETEMTSNHRILFSEGCDGDEITHFQQNGYGKIAYDWVPAVNWIITF